VQQTSIESPRPISTSQSMVEISGAQIQYESLLLAFLIRPFFFVLVRCFIDTVIVLLMENCITAKVSFLVDSASTGIDYICCIKLN